MRHKAVRAIKYFSCNIFPFSLILCQLLDSKEFYIVPGLAIVAMSLLDISLNEDSDDTEDSDSILFKLALWLYVPMQYLMILFTLHTLTTQNLTTTQLVCLILSNGFIAGTFGITVAHDLCHGTKFDKFLSYILLFSVNYPTFVSEHIHTHHRWVATEKDPGTSRFNQHLYSFLLRSFVQGFIEVIRTENERLRQGKSKNYIFNNRVFLLICTVILINLLIAALCGAEVMILFIISSFISMLCIHGTNYLQHYGLERKKTSNGRYEKMQPYYAWHSYGLCSKYCMVNMQRHGDHHANPSKPYQNLSFSDEVPILPFSNPLMFLIALVPPLWFKIMNPRVMEVRSRDYYQN